jgi:hypothetical protein
MSKEKLCLLTVLSLISASVFAGKDSSIKIQNTVRLGYDDNIYQAKEETGSAFVSDIFNISGKMTFSERSELLLFWQPEFKYRFDADPEAITYQDVYGRFSHGLTQNVFFQLSDRFRYQQKGAQSGANGVDNNFIENNLKGALDFTLSKESQVKVGAGYSLRRWDDDNYGQTLGNDYDQFVGDASYLRELKPNKTTAIAGVNYVNHSFDGDRGGYQSTALYLGVDQNFTPAVSGNLRVGGSFSTIDTGTEENDAYAPYLQGKLLMQASEDTTFTGSIGYSMDKSENSGYNAQDSFKFDLGLQHKLTSKLTLSSTVGYTLSFYNSDYARNVGINDDAEDRVFRFKIRASYEINKNNFVDLGYAFTTRDTTEAQYLTEYNRNVVDLGWRFKF